MKEGKLHGKKTGSLVVDYKDFRSIYLKLNNLSKAGSDQQQVIPLVLI
jgi:hypothetical protein